jgi:hypothetical protein
MAIEATVHWVVIENPDVAQDVEKVILLVHEWSDIANGIYLNPNTSVKLGSVYTNKIGLLLCQNSKNMRILDTIFTFFLSRYCQKRIICGTTKHEKIFINNIYLNNNSRKEFHSGSHVQTSSTVSSIPLRMLSRKTTGDSKPNREISSRIP